MYLMETTDGLVLPYTRLLVKMFSVELPIQVPIKELRTREMEDREVAAVMLLLITDKACPLSLASTCKYKGMRQGG